MIESERRVAEFWRHSRGGIEPIICCQEPDTSNRKAAIECSIPNIKPVFGKAKNGCALKRRAGRDDVYRRQTETAFSKKCCS